MLVQRGFFFFQFLNFFYINIFFLGGREGADKVELWDTFRIFPFINLRLLGMVHKVCGCKI